MISSGWLTPLDKYTVCVDALGAFQEWCQTECPFTPEITHKVHISIDQSPQAQHKAVWERTDSNG